LVEATVPGRINVQKITLQQLSEHTCRTVKYLVWHGLGVPSTSAFRWDGWHFDRQEYGCVY